MPRKGTVTIAAAQYPIGQPASIDAWAEKIRLWVGKGAATGADLLVFPEYAAIEQAACFGPDVYESLERTLDAVAGLAQDCIALHAELAREHGVHILVGSGPQKTSDGRYVNAAQLVTPKGSIGVQEKIIMTPFERDWGISPGGPLRVFETGIGKIAAAICYDCEFPLLTRALAEAGAEILLIPSCTEKISGYHRVRTGAKSRALENTITAVQSSTVGDAPWSRAVDFNAGAAGIYVPPEHGLSDHGVVAEGTINKAQWITGKVDLAHLRDLRTSGEMRNFADWSEQPGAAPLAGQVEIVQLD